MNTWVRRTARVGILSAGFLLAGATAAHADTTATSTGNNGTLSGNQISAPVDVPVDVCGNGIGVLGVGVPGAGHCATGADEESATLASGNNDGTLSGNQVSVPVHVPVNVCDNGIGVLGVGLGGSSHCATGAADEESATLASGNNDGTLSGNQVSVPVHVPVQVCGNGIGVLGLGVGGDCAEGSSNGGYSRATEGAEMDTFRSVVRPVVNHRSTRANHRSALQHLRPIMAHRSGGSVVRADGDDAMLASSGNWGTLSGNQVSVPVEIPVNVVDNGIAVGGVGVGAHGSSTAIRH